MRVAVISPLLDSSPKVLAEGLGKMLDRLGIEHHLFHDVDALERLVPSRTHPRPASLQDRFDRWREFGRRDNALIRTLRGYDIIVFCECSPTGFLRGRYNIEALRTLTRRPVVFYEVYYLGNAPARVEQLAAAGEPTEARYDWHFSVSETTEIRTQPSPARRWTSIGLDISKTSLRCTEKKEFLVIVDFEQEGFEGYRRHQLEVLSALNIPHIALSGRYPMEELRALYNRAAVLCLQSFEAFGVPIAEMFATGGYVMTPTSAWPMAWRLDAEPVCDGEGTLPEIFKVYGSDDAFGEAVLEIKGAWHHLSTPRTIFERFVDVYPQFYYGDVEALSTALRLIDVRP